MSEIEIESIINNMINDECCMFKKDDEIYSYIDAEDTNNMIRLVKECSHIFNDINFMKNKLKISNEIIKRIKIYLTLLDTDTNQQKFMTTNLKVINELLFITFVYLTESGDAVNNYFVELMELGEKKCSQNKLTEETYKIMCDNFVSIKKTIEVYTLPMRLYNMRRINVIKFIEINGEKHLLIKNI